MTTTDPAYQAYLQQMDAANAEMGAADAAGDHAAMGRAHTLYTEARGALFALAGQAPLDTADTATVSARLRELEARLEAAQVARCAHDWRVTRHGIARHCNRCGALEPVPALDPRRDPQTLTPDELRGWRVTTTDEPATEPASAPAHKPTPKPCQACGGTGGEYDPGVWMYPDGSGEPPSFEACPECLGHQVETAPDSDDWQDDPLCPNCGERLNCAYEDAGDKPCANCGWTR